MHVTLVHVHVKLEHVDEFILATRANHADSVREPGNARFDVLQSAADPTRFLLYEVYRSAEAAAAHKRTDHYLTWREAVKDWMASERRGERYDALAPQDPESW